MHQDETPEEAAHREASEEISPVPHYRVVRTEEQDCGCGWKFHLVVADVDAPFDALLRHETDATGWFTLAEMMRLPLHPGMKAWAEGRPAGR